MEKSNYHMNDEIREEINNLLKKNASIEASLGKDSTEKDKIKAKIKQDRLFQKIKELDVLFFNICCKNELDD